MHVLTNAEKLIPLRDAASLAESRRLAGMRMVTGTTSPSTRYERISVSPASCSIKSEYVIASHAFKPQYKCINYIPTWEQRKLSEVATFGGGHTPPMADPDNYEDGYVLWVTSQDVKSNYLDRTTTQITEKGAKELTLYPAGSLVMVTRSGILRHTLPVAELRKPSTVNQDIRVILPQGECCGEWLLQFFISHNKELLLEFGKTGTTVESVDFGKIKDMLLYMPSTVEQQQIGDFFAKLDSLITLHQRKRQWLKWLDEGGEGTHHDIDILVFKFADDMKISVLCGVHACMTKSLGHTGNRYAGKQQQRGMGVP